MENNEGYIHEESGLTYYEVAMSDDLEQKVVHRLFESNKPSRLEFETQDEYRIRRLMNKRRDKNIKAGHQVWNTSRFGTRTPERALEVYVMIQEERAKVQEVLNKKKEELTK